MYYFYLIYWWIVIKHLMIYVVFTRIYSIYELYYSIISLHQNTHSLLKILNVIFLWSVNIFNSWPNKIIQNVFWVLNILSSSFSVTIYRICGMASLRIQNGIGFISCIMEYTWTVSYMDVTFAIYTWKSSMKNPCFMGYSNIVSSSWTN